jgi:hypothetical protein
MGRRWWVDDAVPGSEARRGIRQTTVAALVLVLIVLVLQVAGTGGVNEHVNGFTILLLLLAIVLGFAIVAPAAVKAILDRVTTFKVAGLEIGLQAANRSDLLRTQLLGEEDELTPADDVAPSSSRPVGGGPEREFAAVRGKLEERLRYVRDAVLRLDSKLEPIDVAEELAQCDLIGDVEMQIVYDLLGRAEDGIERLDEGDATRYFDRTWRFSTRFATLIFERETRKRLLKRGWFLLDYPQSRGHRPDFLAYKRVDGDEEGTEKEWWFVIAVRIEPNLARQTAARLSRQRPPFDATSVVVVPDRRERQAKVADLAVPAVGLSTFLNEPNPSAWS